jgi:hypothetical protein
MTQRILPRPACLIFAVALAGPVPLGAQELGHKTLGTLGLLAGSQPGSGLYVVNNLAFYSASELVDRNGHPIPVGLDLEVLANMIGLQVTFKLSPRSYMNASLGVPVAHIHLNTTNPEASVDRFGFADVYVQPIKIGWKMTRVDVVTGYAFYIPTGLFLPRVSGNLGQGQWTHEFSLGSTLYFGHAKTWSISALASYDLYQRKRNIDITRGPTVQFQGGIGKTFRNVAVGLTGYGLWQVLDDRGSDLPEPLRGARDRAFGLGPEIDFALASIRSRITVRYSHDVAVNARPLGQNVLVGLTILARH